MIKGNRFNYLYPWIIGVLLLIVAKILKLPVKMKGFPGILESIIQFSGLVIGFYTAMYGLVLVSSNTDIFQKYQQQGVDNIFRSNLRDSLRFAFLAFIMSVIMQELRFHQECVRILSITTSWSQIDFYIWIFIVGVFLGTSYRTIRLLLQLLFNQFLSSEKVLSTTSGETIDERKVRLDKLRN